MSKSVSDSLKRADAYPVGIVFDVMLDAFEARLTSLPDDHVRFDITEGPYARTETVKIAATLIRAGVFAVSWVEADGATVVHVDAEGDFVSIHGRIRGWAPKTQIAVDIFRIENGRLAEHRDVLQDDVPTEASISGLTMFSLDEPSDESRPDQKRRPKPWTTTA